MKVRIRIEQVDNGVVFRWEDVEEIEDPRHLVFSDTEKVERIGREILDDVKVEMDRTLSKIVELDFVEKYYHKFDIQDAKEGNVLYSLDSKQPFIFKHRKPNEQAKVYCGINIYGKFFVGNTKDCIITTDKYIPAAKVQRDFLFSKMKEAGYEWDVINLKLNRISQRMISAEAKEALYDKPAWSEEDMKEALRTEYEKGRADVIAQMQQEWSEKDEKTWKELIEEVKDQLDSVPSPDCRDKEDEKALKQLTRWLVWIESLKQRIGG